MLSLLGNI